MELIHNEIKQAQETKSKGWAISKSQKFAKISEEKSVSDEEKAFYASGKNINKTFISKNRIY